MINLKNTREHIFTSNYKKQTRISKAARTERSVAGPRHRWHRDVGPEDISSRDEIAAFSGPKSTIPIRIQTIFEDSERRLALSVSRMKCNKFAFHVFLLILSLAFRFERSRRGFGSWMKPEHTARTTRSAVSIPLYRHPLIRRARGDQA